MSEIPLSFSISTTNLQNSYLSTAGGKDKSLFGVLNTSSNAQTTAQALATGKLTKQQHDVLLAIGDTGKNGKVVNFNRNREPSIITKLKSLGWIRQVGRGYDGVTKQGFGRYELTTVGREIYRHVGGSGNGVDPDVTTVLTGTQIGQLVSVGDAKDKGYLVPLKNSTEPKDLAELVQRGLVTRTSQRYDKNQRVIVGTYKLTADGQTAYQKVLSSNNQAIQDALAQQDAQATAALKASVNAASSILGSAGVNVFA